VLALLGSTGHPFGVQNGGIREININMTVRHGGNIELYEDREVDNPGFLEKDPFGYNKFSQHFIGLRIFEDGRNKLPRKIGNKLPISTTSYP
jgi:hypothetical protein